MLGLAASDMRQGRPNVKWVLVGFAVSAYHFPPATFAFARGAKR